MKIKTQGVTSVFFAAGFALFCAALPTIGKSTLKFQERFSRGEKISAVKLNERAFDYSRELIKKGQVVPDKRGAWSEHQPSVEQENEFIRLHGFDEYAKWHLGIDEEHAENTKGRYKFPYGDFQNVHRCAVLAAASRAGQYKHYDIENAAAQLEEMIDMKKGGQVKQPPNPNIQTPKNLNAQTPTCVAHLSWF